MVLKLVFITLLSGLSMTTDNKSRDVENWESDPGGMMDLGVTKAVYDEFCANAEVRINFIFDA